MSDDTSEERAMPGAAKLHNLANSGAQNLKNLASSAKQKLLSNNQKATDKLFARLEGGTAQPKLFETTSYQTWLLVEAHQVSKTKNTAQQLEIIQLDNWLTQKTTADDVYSLLELNANEGNLLQNPLLNTWISYIQRVGEGNPLMKKYYGAERLETMFAQAKDSATTTSLALKLEQEMWMSQSKTADDVFNYLKLDKKGGDIFEDSALSTWVSYVNKLNKYKERPDEFAVISILEKRFDYLDLAQMLGNMRGREAETVASLRKLQFKQWMTERVWMPKESSDCCCIRMTKAY
ncbi:hypothetical protein PI125_g12415 [Phytophthora idaei]|nr:hypothetical protein PI125_g12415 [Phytophthora idaei]